MSKLTKYLEIAFAPSSKQKEIMERPSTKIVLGEESYKALLQANAIQSSNLLQEEVYKTISQGAEPFKAMRDVFPIIKTDTYSVRIVKGETGSYAEEVAEGAKVPIDTQVYTKTDISIKKIGTRPLITNELIEDSLFDIVQLELTKAGARMENKLNRDCLNTLLAGKTVTDLDPSNTHLMISDLAKERATIEGYNYIPDTFITHPSAEGYFLQDSNLVYASYAGTAAALNSGKIPKILGMTPKTLSITTGSTSYYWDGTDSSTHYNVCVLDSKAAAYLAMRRDLTVEEYDDPIHDIMGIAATMRYGTAVIQPYAFGFILTK